MQGRGPWMASCIYVCKHESVSVCDFIRLCVCVCMRRGPRLLPEVEFHSLLFHYSYKATARLHRVQSCKNFFFCSLPLLAAFVRPSLLLFLFFSLFDGYSWNGNKHLSNCISLQFGISWRSWAGLIQLWIWTWTNVSPTWNNFRMAALRRRLKQLRPFHQVQPCLTFFWDPSLSIWPNGVTITGVFIYYI